MHNDSQSRASTRPMNNGDCRQGTARLPPNAVRPFDDVFSFHFGFSGCPAALENLRWHHAVRGLKLTTRSDRNMLRPGSEARWKWRAAVGNAIFRRQV